MAKRKALGSCCQNTHHAGKSILFSVLAKAGSHRNVTAAKSSETGLKYFADLESA